MSNPRYSIRNALRQTRGARNSAEKAAIRYGKRPLVRAHVRRALERLNQAERELCSAVALAWREDDARRAA